MEIITFSNKLSLSVDGRFNIFHGKYIYIWYGKILIDGKALSSEWLNDYEKAIESTFINTTGVGILIIIDSKLETVNMYTTFHKSHNFFVKKNKKGLYVYIGIKKFLSHETVSLNENHILEFLLNNEIITGNVVFNDLYATKPGFIEVRDKNFNIIKSELRINTHKTEVDSNLFDYIQGNIECLNDGRESALFYSGGFDSTLLLYILKEFDFKFDIFHKELSVTSNETEFYIAKEKAKKLGLKVKKIEEILDFSIEPYFQQQYDFPHEVPICMSYDLSGVITRGMVNTPYQFISGHGGDAIFGQNTFGPACWDAIKERGIKYGLKKVKELATLKGLTFNMILSNCLKAKKLNYKKFSLGKQEYMNNIIDSIYLIHKADDNMQLNIIAPIIFENIIDFCMQIPAYEHFNKSLDRKVIRKSAYERYGESSFLNTTKKSSSQVVFEVMNKKQRQISDVVKKSGLLELIKLDEYSFEEKLHSQSNVIYNPEDYILIHKLYQMAVYMMVLNVKL